MKTLGLLALSWLLSAAPQTAAPATVSSAADGAAQDAIEKMKAPGVAIAVEIDGRTVLKRGYGVKNLQSKEPVTVNTHFEIGSISKQFTAAAILQLAERHKLSLDDRLAKYVPEYAAGATVTIRELLWQTTGIPNFTEGSDFMQVFATTKPSLQAILARINAKPLGFSPGSDWAYSNTNYVLLARIIELTSGETYDQYVTRHVFKAAGMKDSGFIADESRFKDMATGYYPNGSTVTPSPGGDERWASGAGTVVSLGDMLKWDHALVAGRVVSLQSVRLMRTSGRTTSGKLTGYGMGWYLDTEKHHQRIWHNGGTFGSSAMNATFPADHEIIIVFENNVGVDADTIASGIFGATH